MYELINQLEVDFDDFLEWKKIFYKKCLSHLDESERNRGIIVECVVRMLDT